MLPKEETSQRLWTKFSSWKKNFVMKEKKISYLSFIFYLEELLFFEQACKTNVSFILQTEVISIEN